MINTKRIAESASFRHTLWRAPKKTGGATLSSPRRQAAPPESCRLWSMLWAKAVVSLTRTKSDRACLLQQQLVTYASTMQRYLLPRAAARRKSVWHRQWQRHWPQLHTTRIPESSRTPRSPHWSITWE